MMKISRIFAFLIVSIMLISSSFSRAETSNNDADKSWLLSFIEQKISAPNRQIHISDIQGALSSDATIGLITVGDANGIWLKITNAKMSWNRLDLLRGRVSIDELSADQIEVLRKPLPSIKKASPESNIFSVPELPVGINLKKLNVKSLSFGADLFGLASQVSLNGYLKLSGGNLDTNLAIARLDEAGNFDVVLNLSNDKRTAKIDIQANEPQNGIVANILKVENRPPMVLAVQGEGKLDDLVVNLNMQASHQPVLTGKVSLGQNTDGQTVSANLSGPIAMLMPAQYSTFFGSQTTLETFATLKKTGGLRLDKFNINGASIQVSAIGDTTSDGFLRRLKIDANIASSTHQALILPVAGGKTHADKIAMNVDYGAAGQLAWSGQIQVVNFANENFNTSDITIDMGGISENLDDPAKRHVGIQLTGAINGIQTNSVKIAEALGKTMNINIDADIIADQPVALRDVHMSANGLIIWLKGELQKFVFTGNLGLKATSLQPLALLSGKPLSGGVDLTAKGKIQFIGLGFDLDLNGQTQNVKTGIDVADRFLNGNITLSGGIKRDTTGFTARMFKLGNDKLALAANGTFSSLNANMDFGLSLSDVALLDPRLKGGLSLKGAARGHNQLVAISLNGAMPQGVLSGKKLQNTSISINALLDNTQPIRTYITGSIDGNGLFDQQPLQMSGNFIDNGRDRQLNDLSLHVGKAQISGNLAQMLNGLITGALHIDAPDISTAAALALSQGQGAIKGDFVFDAPNDKQNAKLNAVINNLNVAGIDVKHLDLNAVIIDPLGQISVDGSVNLQQLKTANLQVNTVQANAKTTNGQMAFDVAAILQNTIHLQSSGVLTNQTNDNHGFKVLNINKLVLTQDQLNAQLSTVATIAFDNENIAIRNFNLNVNGGTVSLDGEMGKQLNLTTKLNNLPVSLVNIFRPEIGASGTLSGVANVKGSMSAPNLGFDLSGRDLTIAKLKQNNIAPLAFQAKGVTDGNLLDVNGDITGGGLQVSVMGKVPLTKGNFDLNVVLNNLPLALANGFVKEQNLDGTITGKAHIGGGLKSPSAQFSLGGQGLKAKILTSSGLTPIGFDAKGAYDNFVLNLEQLNLTGPKGLNFTAQGRVPLRGNGIDLSIKGSAPLGIANHFVAERGAQISGLATLDATVKGSFSQPLLIGNFVVSNGSITDAQTNLRLNAISLNGVLNGNKIELNSVTANSVAGGSISAKGVISTDALAGMPSDIVINFNHTRYNDGVMVAATINGSVTLTGALLRDPLIGGDLTIEKAEITVPDKFGGSALIDVKHKNLTPPIQTTLDRAKIETRPSKIAVATSHQSVPQLQLRIRAPNQIFVRGMGLDVELGGQIGLTGPITDIRPVGGFQMRRGRFNILSQRLDFSEGQVTLVGNLNPAVNFVATSTGSDITVTVTVTGTVKNLNIVFSSDPTLPQDEVLARLLFNRSISELSPFQIAQLASAAAEMSGMSHTSLLGALRANTGLDDLDVVTDAQGNTGVKAGRYIRDNIYLGVEAGSGGSTKGTVNLDISKSLKAKGALGAQGDSSVGVFYEKDY